MMDAEGGGITSVPGDSGTVAGHMGAAGRLSWCPQPLLLNVLTDFSSVRAPCPQSLPLALGRVFPTCSRGHC